MSASANVLVSASFPTSVSSDWQIRVVLIGASPTAAVDHLLKVCQLRARVLPLLARYAPPIPPPPPPLKQEDAKAGTGLLSLSADSGR